MNRRHPLIDRLWEQKIARRVAEDQRQRAAELALREERRLIEEAKQRYAKDDAWRQYRLRMQEEEEL